jgi:hypothetical protein
MSKKVFFILLIANCFQLKAQNKIAGVYNSVSQTFETNNTNYWIDFFKKGSAKIYKDGYVGLMDSTGTILCEPKYDDIYNTDLGIFKVVLNNKYGLIDARGTEIRGAFTSKISEFNSGFATYVQLNKYGHDAYGIIKSDGTFVTEAKYVLLVPREGLGYLFTKESQVGLVDFEGEEKLVFNEKDLTAALADWTVRNDQGIISKQENCAPEGIFNAELLKFEEGFTLTFKKMEDCYKFGFMNKNFKTVIKPKYDWVENFKNGFAKVSNKGKWGVINTKGKLVLPCNYSSVKQASKNRFIVAVANKYGVIDAKNKVIITLKYNPIFALQENLYATHDEKKWGVIDEDEKLILPFEFDGITSGVATKYEREVSLPTGMIRQRLFGTSYYFDKLGNLEPEGVGFSIYVEGQSYFLQNPSFFSPLSSITVQHTVMEEDQIVPKYDFTEHLQNGYKIVGKGIATELKTRAFAVPVVLPTKRYLKGIVNAKDEIIVPIIYDEISNKGTNLLIVSLNRNEDSNLLEAISPQKYGVIDLKNNLIVPIEYDYVQIGSGILILSKRNNLGKLQSGVFDFFVKELIPYSNSFYQIIEGNRLLKEEINNVRFVIDKKGNKIN